MEVAIVVLLAVQLVLVLYAIIVGSVHGSALGSPRSPTPDPNAELVQACAELVRQVQHERSQLIDALIARSSGDYDRMARIADATRTPPPTKADREIAAWEEAFGPHMAETLDAMGDGPPIGLDGNI